MMKVPVSMPCRLLSWIMARTCSTVTRRSMASRIFCEPLSAPIQTRKHPDSFSRFIAVSFSRSARVMHS